MRPSLYSLSFLLSLLFCFGTAHAQSPDRCLGDVEAFVVQTVDPGSGPALYGGLFPVSDIGTVTPGATYGLRSGVYSIQGISTSHPIQLRDGNGFIALSPSASTVEVDGGAEGTFYTGEVDLVVTGNFGTASLYCLNHGYMGLENALVHSFGCPFPSEPSYAQCNDPGYAEYHPYATSSEDCVTGCTDPAACAYTALPFSTSPFGEATTDVCAVVDTVMVHTTGDLAGMTTYKVYIELAEAGDYLASIYGDYRNPLMVETTTTFYQDGAGGLKGQDNYAAVLVLDPSDPVNYDSFITIGYDPASGEAPTGADTRVFASAYNPWTATFGTSGLSLSMTQDTVGGVWYTLPGDPFGYPQTTGEHAGRVLVAQLTTDGELSGTLSGQYFRDLDTAEEMEYRFTVNLGACQVPATVTCSYITAPTQDVTVSLDANGTVTLNADAIYDAPSGTCTPSSLSVDPATLDCTAVGANTVTLTVTDANGNTATGTATVTVVDDLAPTCGDVPDNISVTTDLGQCGATVTWTEPAGADNCGVASVTSTHAPGSTFDVGTTTVTYTVTDDAGNEGTCQFTVTVVDAEAPTCGDVPDNISVTTDLGQCGASVTWTEPAGADNCGVASVTSTHAPGSTFDVGTTTVTYTVTDDAGNEGTCQFTVTVADAEAPTCGDVPDNISVTTDHGQCGASVTWTEPAGADNCGVASVTSTHAPGSTFDVGTTTVTYTVTDDAGNEGTCQFTVTVADAEAPTCGDVPDNISVTTDLGHCGATVTWTEPAGADNCGVASVTSTHAPGSTFDVGTTTVTYTVTDDAGNEGTCQFTVTVADAEAPVFSAAPENQTLTADSALCSTTATWTPPTATDNCPGVTVTSSHDPGDTFSGGTTTVTYTATDAAGNENTSTFTITVNDAEPPVLTASATTVVTVPFESTATVSASTLVEATDNCGLGAIEASLDSVSWATSFETGCAASLTVHVRAFDETGNVSALTRSISAVGEDVDGDGVPWCEEVLGCTDFLDCSYDPAATEDDGSCSNVNCICPDLTGDGQLTVQDLLFFLSDYGCYDSCVADLDGVPPVGVTDLLILLGSMGDVCLDGCMIETSATYDPDANNHDGTCVFVTTPDTIVVADGLPGSLNAFALYGLPEHDRLDVSILTTPEFGTADAAEDGTVTYTPGSNFPGTDTFTYSMMDGETAVVVTVQVVSLVPPAPTQPCVSPSMDGYTYSVVEIGDQCWFAENLRTTNYADGTMIPAGLTDGEWTTTTAGATAVYGEGSSTCNNYSPDIDACDEAQSFAEYGRLYNWYAVDDARGLCPSGWHVPTDGEWMVLEMELGMSESEANSEGWRGADQGTQLKSTSGWSDNGNGTDDFGFSALPGGDRNHGSGNFGFAGTNCVWWSSSPNGTDARTRNMVSSNSAIFRGIYTQRWGFSVRCLQDADVLGCTDPAYLEYNADANADDGSCATIEGCTDPAYLEYNEAANTDDGSCTTLVDVNCVPPTMDGYDYDVVQIGDQCWFAENLRTTTYADGTVIPAGLTDGEWTTTTTGATAVYGEGSSSCSHISPDIDACDEAQSLVAYGRLYNGYAATDPSGLCPSGWHVPTDGEWTELEDYITSQGFAGTYGAALKSTSGWFDNGNGTDEFGFSALPGGSRSHDDGSFNGAGFFGYWRSSSSDLSRVMVAPDPTIGWDGSGPRSGQSVRCLRDADVLGCTDPAYLEYNAEANVDDGSCATLVDVNCVPPTMDGYDYDVVQIGDQCWFAENLRTTTYADGTVIPAGLTEGEWLSTTSGATAVYGEGTISCNTISPDIDACDEAQSLAEYGRLYNWYAVDDERKLCPSGWHIPTDGEWMALEMELGMSESEANSIGYRGTDEGTRLKSTSGWRNDQNGTDDFGFSALPGGIRNDGYGVFTSAGSSSTWWSSSPDGSSAWSRLLIYHSSEVFRSSRSPLAGHSVRCIRDADVLGCTDPAYLEYNAEANVDDGSCATPVVTGCMDPAYLEYNEAANTDDGSCANLIDPNCVSPTLDGYSYDVVQLGGQCWFAENLRTTTYADGTAIPGGLDDATWSTTGEGALALYGEGAGDCNDYHPDFDACDETLTLDAFGLLYNSYAVVDARGICPSGWHAPTDEEWQTMEAWLGVPADELTAQSIGGRGQAVQAGTQLRSATGWNNGGGGTDAHGFNGVSSGLRVWTGLFQSGGDYANYWAISASGTRYYRWLWQNSDGIGRGTQLANNGLSVRCVQDPATLGCTDPAYLEYDAAATADDGSCTTLIVSGCTDPAYLEYNEAANTDDGSCATPVVTGCTVPAYIEYDPAANTDDGSCATLVTVDCVSPSMVGYAYDVVQIGGQCWFAENLRTTHYADGSAIPSDLTGGEWGTTMEGATAVYGEGESDCSGIYADFDVCNASLALAEYGRLYNWYAVDDARGLCPSGWRVPTMDDWDELASFVAYQGYTDIEGSALKATTGWYYGGNGTDNFGFSGLPGGVRDDQSGIFEEAGGVGNWWSATNTEGVGSANSKRLHRSTDVFINVSSYYKYGLSVRCLADGSAPNQGCTDPGYEEYDPTASLDDGSCATPVAAFACGDDVTFDGYTYYSVDIGGQCWFTENLRSTNYADGTPIESGLGDADWSTNSSGASAVFGEGEGDCFSSQFPYDWCTDEAFSEFEFGRLYNHHAVTNPAGLCPTGWHVPTDSEWNDLQLYVESSIPDPMGVSAALRYFDLWDGMEYGTDDFGFGARPGGQRYDYGGFGDAGSFAYFWSSTLLSATEAYSFEIDGYTTAMAGQWNVQSGFSVRCLYDGSTPAAQGCTDPNYQEYDATATVDDGSCGLPHVFGCTDPAYAEYDATATQDNGTCFNPAVLGCTDPAYLEYDASATTDDGSCATIEGCTDPAYLEYAAAANTDDGSCTTLVDPNCVPPTMDGYDYDVVQIGDQCWFAENLQTTTYRNGANIPEVTNGGTWTSTNSGARCNYNNSSSWVDDYGRLYNWFAVNTGLLCPSGWHVPTDGEWMVLEMELGMSASEANSTGYRGTNQGTQLKNTCCWLNGGNGTDDFGFSGPPGGARSDYCSTTTFDCGNFYGRRDFGTWWSSSPSGGNAWNRKLGNNNSGISRTSVYNPRTGMSVRCLRDGE